MGLFDRIINRVVDNVTYEATRSIGNSIGDAVGDIASEAGKSLTNEIKSYNQDKELEMDEKRKAATLPALCPHCNAPTNKKIVCEYCDSKIVE